MRRSFRNVPGVESVRVEYIPYQKRHGTIGELGGLTAKITLTADEIPIDAISFANAIRNLEINKIATIPKKSLGKKLPETSVKTNSKSGEIE